MVIVSSFDLTYNDASGFFTVTTKESASCPFCKGDLVYRDSKPRILKYLSGGIRHFLLRRFRCRECNKLHTELPDIIQPYKHYESGVIQSVIEGSEDAADCVADDSTVRRWKNEFTEAEPDINQRLASVYAHLSDGEVPIAATVHILDRIKAKAKRWLAFVMKLLINSGYRIRTRFAFCPPSVPDKVSSESKNATEGGKKGDKTIKNTC